MTSAYEKTAVKVEKFSNYHTPIGIFCLFVGAVSVIIGVEHQPILFLSGISIGIGLTILILGGNLRTDLVTEKLRESRPDNSPEFPESVTIVLDESKYKTLEKIIEQDWKEFKQHAQLAKQTLHNIDEIDVLIEDIENIEDIKSNINAKKGENGLVKFEISEENLDRLILRLNLWGRYPPQKEDEKENVNDLVAVLLEFHPKEHAEEIHSINIRKEENV